MSQNKAAAADELIYLQRVELSEISYLQEVLYWVAFGRLPIWLFDFDEKIQPVLEDYFKDDALTDDECESSTPPLPPDPRTKYDWSYGVTLYQDLAAIEAVRAKYDDETGQDESVSKEQAQKEAANLHREISEWKPKFQRAIELPTTKIYAALREGHLTSKGLRLPDPDLALSLKMLAEQGKTVDDLEEVAIPKGFWSFQHIFWENSTARNDSAHYCCIKCATDEMLRLFPHSAVAVGKSVDGVKQHGSFFVLSSNSIAASPSVPARRSRRSEQRGRGGRPSIISENLLLDIVALCIEGLPEKKEAAVEHLRAQCMKREERPPAARTLRDRLTPFYERFRGGNSGS